MSTTIENQNDRMAAVAELVQSAQNGDRHAFGELARRFEGMVYALGMRRLGNHSEAQELTQEVLMKAFEKLHQLEAPAAFGGWLRSITVRMAINRRVRRAPMIAAEPQILESTCLDRRTPVDVALEHERAREVRSGLGRLGELERERDQLKEKFHELEFLD